ncbi:hypothetical protein ABT061_21865 [Streptosporangium sp. NPDC002544]|uniref:hypothetical protein n=1 Tax=Streptosporangium sp. NPDC002544 TaxID=3154538 RepID=UPI003327A480
MIFALTSALHPSDGFWPASRRFLRMNVMGKSKKQRQSAQPSAEELEVRQKLGQFAAQHAAAAKQERELKVSQEEQQLRRRQGKFMRVRANTPGTAEYANRQRQREESKTDDAIRESAHDPETFNSDDW